jgi:tetratricopeptide (TPR) repeat protein
LLTPPARHTFRSAPSRRQFMRQTDNQPESVAIRYAALVSAVMIAGGGVLRLVGLGFPASLFVAAGVLLALITGVLYLVFKVLAIPAADALLRFLGVQSGSSTPPVKGYSWIEALVAQGRFDEAAKAYRGVIEADPGDVEARSRLAQLSLDHLGDPAAAARQLREARDVAAGEPRKVGLSLRLIDLYRSKLHDRGKALVEVRRFLDTFPASPHADGVRRELAELLAEVKAEQEAGPP